MSVARSMEREYLFVDGGCLRASVRTFCRSLFGDESAYKPYIQGLVGSFDKVFYYDAISGREYRETQEAYAARVQPEHERFERIQALDRVHVALGKIVGKDRRQKGVDVRLAVDIMTHAFRGTISRATLLASDADFVPLVRALVNEGLHVTLWHPPQASKELMGAADSNRPFSFRTDCHCFSLDEIAPAFLSTGFASRQIDLSDQGLAYFIKASGQQFSGAWDGNTLTIFKLAPDGQRAEMINLIAPGSTLKNALSAFQAIHGWDVANDGENWVRPQSLHYRDQSQKGTGPSS
ncbi:NYN domain-containing protein [Agrobacterium sp. ES01]|uniref:NYN domain-containing protein n=1 Tax=Agrobacterium sp. ES01 TaxID=3420714 RepID=UPI003D0B52E5